MATWRRLWIEAGWLPRAGFVLLALVFLNRATYALRTGRADRLGFMDIGSAVLQGGLDRDPAINTYPPPFSVAMAPLAALFQVLGDPLHRWLWGIAQLLALGVATRRFGLAFEEPLSGAPLSLAAIAVAWACSARFIISDLNNQNVSLFLLALLASALTKPRPGRRGFWLAIGGALKLWPAAAAIALAVPSRRRRAEIVGLVAGALVAGLGTVGVLGAHRALQAWTFWLCEVAPAAGGAELSNQSWKAEILRLSGVRPGVWQASGWGTFALATGLAGWVAIASYLVGLRPSRSRRGAALDGAISAIVFTMVLPVVWPLSYVVCLPVGLGIGTHYPELRKTASGRTTVLIFAAGSAIAGLFDYDLVGRAIGGWAAFLGNQLLGVGAIAAAGLRLRKEFPR